MRVVFIILHNLFLCNLNNLILYEKIIHHPA